MSHLLYAFFLPGPSKTLIFCSSEFLASFFVFVYFISEKNGGGGLWTDILRCTQSYVLSLPVVSYDDM